MKALRIPARAAALAAGVLIAQAWANAPILIGWEHYLATGDLDQLQRNYAVLAGRIQSGIGSGSWCDSLPLADWPSYIRDDLDSTRRGNVVTNAWVFKSLMTIADILNLAIANVVVDNRSVPGVFAGEFMSIDSLPPGRHVLTRGIPVALPSGNPDAEGGEGWTPIPGAGTVRFRWDGRSGPAALTIRDLRGNALKVLDLAAGDATVALPPGLYLAAFERQGRRPAAAKFMVR